MMHVNQAVIVEGKYDKIRLQSVVDALIIPVDGFRIFKNDELKQFLKRLASERGIIILTDSDAAGFKIRNYIRNICGDENVINAYIPDIFGKEKRKDSPSREGKLGVEGIDSDILLDCLKRAGVSPDDSREGTVTITSAMLYQDKIIGTDNSNERRRALLRELRLPQRLRGKSLLEVLNTMISYEEYTLALAAIDRTAGI